MVERWISLHFIGLFSFDRSECNRNWKGFVPFFLVLFCAHIYFTYNSFYLFIETKRNKPHFTLIINKYIPWFECKNFDRNTDTNFFFFYNILHLSSYKYIFSLCHSYSSYSVYSPPFHFSNNLHRPKKSTQNQKKYSRKTKEKDAKTLFTFHFIATSF